MINRTIWVLALLLVSAMVINWYQDSTEKDRGPPPVAVSEPDLYMVNALIDQYDESGQLHHQIRAGRFTHFTVTDTTYLEKPSITLFDESSAPWTIASAEGRILAADESDQQVVELWNGVSVQRRSADGRFITITTDRLTILPDTEYAATNQPVSIETNDGRTEAAGMTARLRPMQLVFTSNRHQRVSTTIQPPQ